MSKEQEIEEMAKALEQAKIKASNYIGSMNNGFGHWYATELYNIGCRIFSNNELQHYYSYKIIESQIKGCMDKESQLIVGNKKIYDRTRKETAREILILLKQFLIEKFNYFEKLEAKNCKAKGENRIFDLGEMDMANCALDRVNDLLRKYEVE